MISGYNRYRKDNGGPVGGGVTLYVKKGIDSINWIKCEG